VRRRLIRSVLPLIFCALPFLAAGAVAAAIEPAALNFYKSHITWMDILILGLGATLFVTQMLLAWLALHWRETSFDERFDGWLSHLAQSAEWFPLLGLLGTVAAILQTFDRVIDFSPPEIIRSYAPAITATGSGLFMALVNILPTWLVPVGRDLIAALGGSDEVASPPGRAKPAPALGRSRAPSNTDSSS
jgi:hypothetical protein